MKPKLLIVDDDSEILTQMKWALSGDYEVLQASDTPTTLEQFCTHRPEVVMLDLGLPPHPNTPEVGLSILNQLLALDARTKVVVASGQSEKENALKAIGSGAYDFFSKPLEMEPLRLILKRCFYVSQMEREHRESRLVNQEHVFEDIIGSSAVMRKVFDTIRKVASTDAPVLILGESGTGKEMTAGAIHRQSPRREGPFVAINCGAIPETLLESELFGHEKGAFTGAHAQKQGRFENANRGTLFLDEIGEMPLSLQVKLLRFLQEKKIVRVGGRQEIEVDARVIAATNVDVKKHLQDGTLREDLYYRLAVVQIDLPPLRNREEDITLLANTFLMKSAEQFGKKGLNFAEDALNAIRLCKWPGNVRELENRIRRAVILSDGYRITAEQMELVEPTAAGAPSSLREARMAVEKEMVQKALTKHRGKISAAAEELGISRPTLYELMEKLGLQQS